MQHTTIKVNHQTRHGYLTVAFILLPPQNAARQRQRERAVRTVTARRIGVALSRITPTMAGMFVVPR